MFTACIQGQEVILQALLCMYETCGKYAIVVSLEYYHCRFVNGVYEFGYAEGHRGSIVEVAGKVWTLVCTMHWS